MVHIKFSVIFILAAATIAPVIALPIPTHPAIKKFVSRITTPFRKKGPPQDVIPNPHNAGQPPTGTPASVPTHAGPSTTPHFPLWSPTPLKNQDRETGQLTRPVRSEGYKPTVNKPFGYTPVRMSKSKDPNNFEYRKFSTPPDRPPDSKPAREPPKRATEFTPAELHHLAQKQVGPLSVEAYTGLLSVKKPTQVG